MTKRKRYSNDFKARVALEAIREELTLAELSKKHGGHPNMISGWKRSAIKNMARDLVKMMVLPQRAMRLRSTSCLLSTGR